MTRTSTRRAAYRLLADYGWTCEPDFYPVQIERGYVIDRTQKTRLPVVRLSVIDHVPGGSMHDVGEIIFDIDRHSAVHGMTIAETYEDMIEGVHRGLGHGYIDENGVRWRMEVIPGGIRFRSRNGTLDVPDAALDKFIEVAREGHEAHGFAA